MGKIKVNTDFGPVLINIAGDSPTEKEKNFILENLNTFQKESSSRISPNENEIANYYRQWVAQRKWQKETEQLA